MNTYVSREDDVFDKLIDVAHHHEAVIEGKRVAHQILDSDGKVSDRTNFLLQFFDWWKLRVDDVNLFIFQMFYFSQDGMYET